MVGWRGGGTRSFMAVRLVVVSVSVLGVNLGLVRPASADLTPTYSQVAGQLRTSTGVALRLEKAPKLSEGVKSCGDTIPQQVDPSSVRNFCYYEHELFPKDYDTTVTFTYTLDLPNSDRTLKDSGYDLIGYESAKFGAANPLTHSVGPTCVIRKVQASAPDQHFRCTTDTVQNRFTSNFPEPHWNVTWDPIPSSSSKVYFIGDSVTAGFGYCGSEGGASKWIDCGTNTPISNAWIDVNSITQCQPQTDPVDDRCSNNNYTSAPWNAGPWLNEPGAPDVAYPYVIAKEQDPRGAAAVYDWAMTGSTPADWDAGGPFSGQLERIKDSYVVMTLGANPLLSDYLAVGVPGVVGPTGPCADSTVIAGFGSAYAAPLDALTHDGHPGVLYCFEQKWAQYKQGEHLLSVYKTLLQHGNRVVVLGYPAGCPWSFGTWQPLPGVPGPASGQACTSKKHPDYDDTSVQISQWDQAQAVSNDANAKIKALVELAGRYTSKPGNITFALPDQSAWAAHQPPGSNSWEFLNDTWVHPNADGHKQLATTVVAAMCDAFRHWCGGPPKW
jgi:hypothetical protein